MKAHTNEFKEEVKLFGRQLDSKLTYTQDGETIELGNENLNSITPHYEGNILKSVMKQLDIDSNIEIPIGTELNYKFGVKTRSGKNLLNIQTIVKGRLDNGVLGYASDTSDLILNNNNFSFTTTKNYRGATTDYIEVKPNTTYVFSSNQTQSSSFQVIGACYDEDKTYIGDIYTGSLGNTYRTFTTRTNTKYVRLYFYLSTIGNITVEYPQVEIWQDSPTEYERYGMYDYIDFGNYIVKESEKQEDTRSWKITCYDKMLYSMKPYEKMNITYPITLRNYLSAICNKIGITFASVNDNFANYNREIPSELYLSYNETQQDYVDDMGYTFRDVLDEIASATASTICINENNELEVRYITNSNDTIDAEYLKDINVNFGEKYGPVNSIVLSRSGESDNVYTQDTSSVEINGLCEIKIIDNQIMNRNDRADYLPDLLSKLDGLEYYLNDFSSTGICYYDICDKYTINIDNTNYSCVMFNDEINITQGLNENIHTDRPEESETDYSKSDKTDRKINQTYLIVDKQNQTIQSVVSNISEQDEKISQITQTVNEINSKITDISGITTQADSQNATVSLEDVNASEPITIKIHPISESVSYLYPYNGLYPSATLYLKNRVLRFTNTTTYEETTDSVYLSNKDYFSLNGSTYTLLVAGTDYIIGNVISGTIYQHEIFDWELPTDLWYLDSNTYDELELSYGDGTSASKMVYVTRKCQINSSGVISATGNTVIETYSYPTGLKLTTGDYTITMLGYSNGYLLVQLMASNIYTTQFPTRAEMNSEINQTATNITSTVSMTYATKNETTDTTNANSLISKITQNSTSITSEVSRATNSESSLSSRISQTATGISLSVNNGSTSSGITITTTKEDGTTSTTSGTIEMNGLVKFTNLYDGTTTISGSNITTGTIKSSNYIANSEGTKIELSNGIIDSKNFKIKSNGDVEVSGKITTTSGIIGGWSIGGTNLHAGSGSSYVGLNSSSSVNSAFWAGSEDASNAPLRITKAGKLTATDANITGTINATSGSFTGSVNATSGTFRGSLYSSSGTIGGWTLASNGLTGTDSEGNTIRISTTGIYLSGNVPFPISASWKTVLQKVLS